MEYFIKRGEAEEFPKGMRFKNKKTGTEYVIEKECGCGDWLHYEVKQVDNAHNVVWHHLDIERLCEIIS